MTSLPIPVLQRPAEAALLRALKRVDTDLKPLHQVSRMLMALTARGAVHREHLVEGLQRGEELTLAYARPDIPEVTPALKRLDHLRRQIEHLPLQELYSQRFDELELELCLLSELGRPRAIRPLSARRFGCGADPVMLAGEVRPVSFLARRILDRVQADDDPRVLPPAGKRGEPSFAELIAHCAAQIGLSVRVVVEPRLVAGAAAGDRTVFIAARHFGQREAARLCVHEVLGHLTAAANGRAQPLRFLEWGTGGAFTDQEGLSLYLEDAFGLLDRARLRTLAARVVATDAMHDGATFTDVARRLHRDEGLSAEEAVATAERAFRGGGVARDAAYLVGFMRVSGALERGLTDVDTLRSGRLSLRALGFLPELMALGLARPAVYRPNFSRSFVATSSGTIPCRLPPRAAASLIRDELT